MSRTRVRFVVTSAVILALTMIATSTALPKVVRAATPPPPPSLQGEEFGAGCGAFPPQLGGPLGPCFSAGSGSVTVTCTPQPDGGAILSFKATGLAIGLYLGTFSESGTYTLGPSGTGSGMVGSNVTSFSSTFNIQSTEGVVSGTKNSSGVPQNVDINFSTCIPGDLSSFAGANANYVATIQTAQGSFRDTGLTRAQVGGPTPGAEGFWEPFETSNGVVPICNQNSQVNQGQPTYNQGCVNP